MGLNVNGLIASIQSDEIGTRYSYIRLTIDFTSVR